jgi:hypothetical protein
MIPIVIYTAISACGIVYARTLSPTEVLHESHHRRLYWAGAATFAFLVAAFTAPLLP